MGRQRSATRVERTPEGAVRPERLQRRVRVPCDDHTEEAADVQATGLFDNERIPLPVGGARLDPAERVKTDLTARRCGCVATEGVTLRSRRRYVSRLP
jgi:hypothetical protein